MNKTNMMLCRQDNYNLSSIGYVNFVWQRILSQYTSSCVLALKILKSFFKKNAIAQRHFVID